MCYNKKPHKFEDIYVADAGWNEDHVVKWCRKCGSVLIAIESDGRTFGYIGKTRFPENLYEYARMKIET